ncbi:carbonic anhydrase [Raphidocelis subcapitata]|uniref:Carbonic anhydrase n=1 Tax=Raphidocelis subcapitata TaxID=307507 RepID=A0A2V0PJD7_9CHLO|nr:carbonic anhydrase [Raphidocelis subcapitata]|eukprot:GBF97427.1 carbonic anhydrase [Raphidocelis subcapitata]
MARKRAKTEAAAQQEAPPSEGMFDHRSLDRLLESNRRWAASQLEADPQFFKRLVEQQTPEFLWIGCSDSRVPANQIMGLSPGEVFVQRNVGNQAGHTDMNLMACLEYAVKTLKVKTVIVCGHYNCGAVRAALELPSRTPGLVNCWISDIREARNQAAAELEALGPDDAVARLCELNVLRQVFHVCTSPVVQSAWAEGTELHIWGLIYDLRDGLAKRLAGPFTASSEVGGDEATVQNFVESARGVVCPLTQQLVGAVIRHTAGPFSTGAVEGGQPTTLADAARTSAM